MALADKPVNSAHIDMPVIFSALGAVTKMIVWIELNNITHGTDPYKFFIEKLQVLCQKIPCNAARCEQRKKQIDFL